MATKKKEPVSNTVTNCTFHGVHFDAKAVEAIVLIAEACDTNAAAIAENARTLNKLAEVLKASNVTVEAMLKLSSEGTQPCK